MTPVLPVARTPERKRIGRFTEGVTAREVIGAFVPPVSTMSPNVIPSHLSLFVHLLPKGLHAGDQRLVGLGFPRAIGQISSVDGIRSNQRACIRGLEQEPPKGLRKSRQFGGVV